jgi:flagellar biogenesis protein FliO
MSASGTGVTMSEVKIQAAADGPRTFESASRLARFFMLVLTLLRNIKIQRRERSMRLCETLPLGEKRFLAIVQIEHQRFLIAATNQSISLLHCLDGSSQPYHRHPAASRDSSQDGTR